jgi:hypothetical protein
MELDVDSRTNKDKLTKNSDNELRSDHSTISNEDSIQSTLKNGNVGIGGNSYNNMKDYQLYDKSPNMKGVEPKQQKNNERSHVKITSDLYKQQKSPTTYEQVSYLGEADHAIDDLTLISPRDSIYMAFPELSSEFVHALYSMSPHSSYKFLQRLEVCFSHSLRRFLGISMIANSRMR